ncbi:MAG: PAS domain-containing sensor histidine kinase [Bacteroidales bacterium]|nr:PAS domain-containing sensor histidine kinase [Bacteroidales bacterium]
MAVVAYVVKKYVISFSGISFWIYSSICIAIGYMLVSQRGEIPDILSVVIAQSCFVVAAYLRLFGINKFFGRKNQLWLYILVFGVSPIYFFLLIYFTLFINSIFIRTIFVGLYLSILSVITGIQMVKEVPQNQKNIYYVIAGSFFLFASIFIVRVAAWVFIPEIRGLLSTHFFNYVQFLSSMIIDIAWTTLFVFINHQKLQEEISNEREKFQTIFESNSLAMFIANLSNSIILVNDRLCKLLGSTRQELIGQNWKELINYNETEPKQAKITSFSDFSEKALINYEFGFKTKEGKAVFALINISAKKKLGIIIVSITDISQLKQNELKLELQAKLLNKLSEDKSLFLSVIGHDLRTPFSNLINLTDILYENFSALPAEKIKNNIRVINSIAKTAFFLFDDLLIWSKTQDGSMQYKPVIYNFALLCEEVIMNISAIADRKNIKIAHSHKNVSLFIDVTMMHIVLRNLITNAIKYSNENTKIFIDVIKAEDYDCITVTDEGLGMPDETLKNIWNRKKNNQENNKAGGLGLILCKEFVEKHDGFINVESILGQGTSFKIYIPSYKHFIH